MAKREMAEALCRQRWIWRENWRKDSWTILTCWYSLITLGPLLPVSFGCWIPKNRYSAWLLFFGYKKNLMTECSSHLGFCIIVIFRSHRKLTSARKIFTVTNFCQLIEATNGSKNIFLSPDYSYCEQMGVTLCLALVIIMFSNHDF